MIIERIQVEGGFLNGLDLRLKTGLNVLIGARGAGKTSVIEIVRFCLGAKPLTDEVTQTARDHVLSILGDGTATVTVTEGGQSITFSRTADEWTTSDTEVKPAAPVILSQNEIEAVGLSASGRLRLIDSIRRKTPSTTNNEERLLSYIRSQTEERQSTRAELLSIRAKIATLAEQLKQAEALKKQHQDALNSIQKAATQTKRLQELDRRVAALSVRTTVYNRALKSLEQWQTKIQTQVGSSFSLEPWPAAALSKEDPLLTVRQHVSAALNNLEQAQAEVEKAIAGINGLKEKHDEEVLKHQSEARELRRQLEALEKGAGETARKLAAIQEQTGQYSALQDLEKTKLKRLKEIQAERKNYLDRLEIIRFERYEERAEVVKELNRELGPQIHVSIERAGQNNEYASAIVAALRGSGLRFNEVAPLIADQMSPREFVEAIENEDADAISNVTGIVGARAARIIERVNELGVEAILTAPIEDGVTLSLLDGKEYKTTEELSTGQRCTVVLPLLLKQRALSLIVDQPEDHLDNAFVVGTLIKAISQRKHEGQLIFATHNANIPVLGGADQVVVMASDGSRGFISHAGRLDDPFCVNAITSLMEGGLEAFDRRAKFYHSQK